MLYKNTNKWDSNKKINITKIDVTKKQIFIK